MRLYTTPASPWVRRCVVSILELGLDDKVDRIPTRWPHSWGTRAVDYAPDFLAATPVARIPALVTDDGLSLVDTDAICDFLNTEYGDYRLLPPSGPGRWELMSIISITNGLVEAQISRRAELLRSESERSVDFMGKMKDREHRCYRILDTMTGLFQLDVDLAQIALAAALGYNDFRFSEDWRSANSNLASWYERFVQRVSMQSTMPSETPEY